MRTAKASQMRHGASIVALFVAGGALACSNSNEVNAPGSAVEDAAGVDALADVVQGKPDGAADSAAGCTPGTVAADCPQGMGCVAGACAPCTKSPECGGQLCIQGTCTACKADDECKTGYSDYFVCKQGKCVSTACADDVDCLPSGQICKNYECKACSTSYECVHSQAYGSGFQCLAGQCSSGNCTEHAACPADAPVCGSNKQCRGCQQDQECLARYGVSSGWVCDVQKGLCIEGDCYPDKAACGTASDKICEGNKCRDCTDPADCQGIFGAGFLCISGHCIAGECQSDADCTGRICELSTHKCRDCIAGSDECGAGKTCGTDGKCHTGNCWPPGVECCDQDGNLRLTSYKCDNVAVTTEYRCESAACGADAQQRKHYRFCNGNSAHCDDSNVQPGDWETISDCPATTSICESSATYAQCATCPHGCGNGKCFADCDPASACCNADGTFKTTPCCSAGTPLAAGTQCNSQPLSEEFQCGTTCGGDLQKRQKIDVCTGNDADCGLLQQWTPWTTVKTCSSGYCDTASKDCLTCNNGCNPATVQCNLCPSGQCTINGKCYTDGSKQNDWVSNCNVCSVSSPTTWTQTACAQGGVTGTCSANTGLCSYNLDAGHCAIGGTVVTTGTRLGTNPGDPGHCLRCPGSSTGWQNVYCTQETSGWVYSSGVLEGSLAGTSKQRLDCPQGTAIVALQAAHNTSGLQGIRIGCQSVVSGYPAWTEGALTWLPSASTFSGAVLSTTQTINLACPTERIVAGVQGRVGTYVNALGLMCGSTDQIQLGQTGSYSATAIAGLLTGGSASGPSYANKEYIATGIEISWTLKNITRLEFLSGTRLDCCYTGADTGPAGFGWFDGANATQAWGWACNKAVPGNSSQVDFYFDGPAGTGKKYLTWATADQPSENAVNSLCGGGVAHRFSFSFQAYQLQQIGVGAGSHTVYAYARNSGYPNGLLGGSPRTITIP